MIIRSIAAEQTHPLRQRVLRPHQALREMVYPNDSVDGAGHFGAFQNSEIVGIASVYPESETGEWQQEEWRLRGMAIEPALQGGGWGRALVQVVENYCREQGGRRLWCNARNSALPFYEKLGFQRQGEEFEIPGIGLHFIAAKVLGSN